MSRTNFVDLQSRHDKTFASVCVEKRLQSTLPLFLAVLLFVLFAFFAHVNVQHDELRMFFLGFECCNMAPT